MKRFVFRVDSSSAIGGGHLFRCVNLAKAIRQTGAVDVAFICRDLPGHLSHLVKDDGFDLCLLPPGEKRGVVEPSLAHASWLGTTCADDAMQTLGAMSGVADVVVVDHYAIDEAWERSVRAKAKSIVVIDDLADRGHDCDVIIDQNAYSDPERRYDGLVHRECQRLLGPRFALLAPRFATQHVTAMGTTRGAWPRILIYFGTTDATHETVKAVIALQELRTPFSATVVVGSNNVDRDEIMQRCGRQSNVVASGFVGDFSNVLLASNICVGAGGVTMLERACLGIPSVVISTAQNQTQAAQDMHAAGLLWFLGKSEDATASRIAGVLETLFNDEPRYGAMRLACLETVDGRGLERVTKILVDE